MRLVTLGIVALLVFPIFLMPIINSDVPNNNSYYASVKYSKYFSHLSVEKPKMFNSPFVEMYVVSNSTYYGNTSLNQKDIYVRQSTTTYTLVTGGTETINGKICINSSISGDLYVRTNIPQLARIIVISAGVEEVVWAGFNKTYVHAYAYINGSGKVILQFINGSSITNVTVGIKQNSSIVHHVKIMLTKVTVSSKVEHTSTSKLHVQMPRKYSPLTHHFFVNESTFSSTSKGYTVTTAYFCGKLLPAIVWKGLGVGNLNLGLPTPMSGKVNFTTIGFYGINGTTVGYVHSAYMNTEYHGVFRESSLVAGELLIVHVINAPALTKPAQISLIYHKGVPIILGISNNTVETTADVAIQHQVYVNKTKGLLLMLYLNSSAFYVVATHTKIANVTIVKPDSVVTKNVTIQGRSYLAQVVNVSASGFATFNVTRINNEKFVVFEQKSNGSLVELNPSDYFVVNNTIIVFIDPATTYLVVYGYTPATSTTSSSTAQTQSSTTSSTTLATSSSPSTTNSAQTPTTSSLSTTSPFNNVETIGIILAVVVIIAIGLVVAKRR